MKTISKLMVLGILLAGLIGGTMLRAAERTWTDQQGRAVIGEFAGLNGETVSLRLKDGRRADFPLNRLSDADQAVARDLAKQAGAAAVASLPVPKSLAESAAVIDRLVDSHLTAVGLKPNPALADEQFVRRIYLDVVGRTPSLDETNRFLRDKDKTKRAKLIKQLMGTKGHSSHLFNYYADMLRLETKPNEYISGASYVQWIKENIEKNVPYDEMVRRMLTASGKSWEDPATGYLLRDAGMPLDNLSVTMQVFTGLDLSCAQCHDHPFTDWTQMQFYKLAAFFGQSTTLVNNSEVRKEIFPKSNGNPRRRIEDELKAKGDYTVPDLLMRRMIHTHDFVVMDDPKRLSLTVPHDYRYQDAKPGDVVEPAVVYGTMPKLESFDSRRKAFAAWLTGPENERFAITIANRMWKRAFGRGLADPINSCEDYNETVNPILLKFLGAEMRRLKFDIRAFEEILYNTQAYQRQAFTGVLAMGAPYHFPGPVLRRMTAEQLWDSFLTMILPDPDYFYRRRDYKEWENVLATKPVDEMTGVEAREILSGKITALGEEDGGVYGWPAVADDEKGLVAFDDRIQAFRVGANVLVRASEFSQPSSPKVNFLRQLGQSDRMLIDNGALTGSVPIVLTLMNSSGTTNLTKPGSRVLETIDKGLAVGPKLETAFLSILHRMPDAKERSYAYKAIARDGADGFKNVVWALINTREFLFIQ